jgi:hypothetical protein
MSSPTVGETMNSEDCRSIWGKWRFNDSSWFEGKPADWETVAIKSRTYLDGTGKVSRQCSGTYGQC